MRRVGTKKGATGGSGGQRRRGLEGKGPTPKASERTGHAASRRAGAADRAKGKPGGSGGGVSRGRSSSAKAGAGRRAGGSSEWVAGRNSVVEALRAGIPVKALYIGARVDSDERVREAIKTVADLGLPILEGSKADLDRLTGDALHQGLALQVPPYGYAHPDDLLEAAAKAGEDALIVALDGVTDPRNLGAVVRSAGAFGGHGVIVPERRSAGMTAGAWKASAGAAARVPVARATNLTRALEELKSAGCFVAGLDAEGDVSLPDLELASVPLVLVVGSEGKGLSRLVRQTCDAIVSIPMAGQTESLNAGVAAGVALYEVARRRAR